MNAVRSAFPVPRLVAAALIGSALIVLGSAYISRSNIAEAARLSKALMHTGDALDALARLRSVLHAAETGQRGYLLTGNREYLAPYQRAIIVVEPLLAELKALAAGNERQMRQLAAIEPLAIAKLAELRSTIEALDRGDRESAMAIVRTNRGYEVMEALLAILTDLRAQESRERAVYKDLQQRQTATSEAVGFVTTAVVLLQLGLCYFLLLSYVRRRREAETRLAALNARLEDEVQERTGELQGLSRYLMTVREDEKARIARELHDELGSSLTAVNMDISSAQQRLGPDSTVASRLSRAAVTLKLAVEGMRRIIEDLRPTMLEGLGLREALRALAAESATRMGIPVDIDIPDELPPLPEGMPIGLFRIVQEALTNASRHAKASSVRISLRAASGGIVLIVQDDGEGIVRLAPGVKRTSHGLLGIRERATAMGGTSSVGAAPGGRGTVVRVVVPLSAPAAPDQVSAG